MNIKIVIGLIIILLIPPASASDVLWTSRSSGFIGWNDTLVFGNYRVKAGVIDDATSSISVYKNTNLLGTEEFRMNDVRNYDNISVTLLGINDGRAWISINAPESREFWRFLNSKQLNWGESYSIENHTFEIDTFGSDSANLSISGGNGTERKAFRQGDVYYFGALSMSVTNINRTGFIGLDFFTNRLPDYKTEVFPFVKAGIETDKEEYFPDEQVQASTKVSTDFHINVMGITIRSEGAEKIIPDNFTKIDFSGEDVFQSVITGLQSNTSASIDAKIVVRDYSGNSYELNANREVRVKPEVAIVKLIQADTDDEKVPVQLYVHNSGATNRSVHVHDTIPEELGSGSLDWDIELGPGSSTVLEYNVTPERPGLYFMPSAIAQWEGGGDASKRMKMIMHMPYITIEKSVDYNESDTLVKLVISNSGDRPAQVNFLDNLPSGGTVSGGDTAWSGKLEGGEKKVLQYYLKGEVKNLPDAMASYLDIRGVTRYARSNTIVSGISVAATPPGKSETAKPLNVVPSELVLFMVISFVAIAGVITGAGLVAYLITKTLR